ACAHDVEQDRATGVDGKIEGAKPIKFDNGEGVAKGIVTYPGGDRVDWKSVEVPAGKHGTLDFQLTWQAPRPGLQLAFDVFDQSNTPIVVTKSSVRKRGHQRTATIADAAGTYFVRVYAPRRTDAGTYKLTASFHETGGPIVVKPEDIPV